MNIDLASTLPLVIVGEIIIFLGIWGYVGILKIKELRKSNKSQSQNEVNSGETVVVQNEKKVEEVLTKNEESTSSASQLLEEVE